MMMIAVVALKGGGGKTTLCLHLAGEAMARGKRVLVCDADPQRSALTWSDVAAENKVAAPSVVGVSEAMHKTLPEIARGFDLVVVDCGPSSNVLTRSALAVVDLALVPVTPSPQDVWSAGATAKLIEEARALRPELRAAILLNRIAPRTALSKGLGDGLAGLGLPLLRTKWTNRVAYAEAIAAGQSVATYEPKGPAAAEVRALYEEVVRGQEDRSASPKGNARSRSVRTRRPSA